jgi:hypothetical protein
MGRSRAAKKAKPTHKRNRGPIPGFPNPHPIGDGVDEPRIGWIMPAMLDDSERRLRRFFAARRKELVRNASETAESALVRISKVAREALEETGAVWWSRLEHSEADASPRRRDIPPWLFSRDSRHLFLYYWAAPHLGPTPPSKRAAHGSPWIDTSTIPNVLRWWDKHTKTWRDAWTVDPAEVKTSRGSLERWAWSMTQPSFSLRLSYLGAGPWLKKAAERMLAPGGLGRLGRNGRPAALACGVLGALLRVPPTLIMDSLNQYRRTSPSPSGK